MHSIRHLRVMADPSLREPWLVGQFGGRIALGGSVFLHVWLQRYVMVTPLRETHSLYSHSLLHMESMQDGKSLQASLGQNDFQSVIFMVNKIVDSSIWVYTKLARYIMIHDATKVNKKLQNFHANDPHSHGVTQRGLFQPIFVNWYFFHV